MSERPVTCEVADCTKPARKGGFCWTHMKRKQRGQVLSHELAKRHGSPLERLTEAAITYAHAEEDEEWERAKNNLTKAALAYAMKYIAEATREALARRKAEGVRLGRPRKLEPLDVAQLVQELGGARKAAVRLGVSVRSVRRALRKVRTVRGVTKTGHSVTGKTT